MVETNIQINQAVVDDTGKTGIDAFHPSLGKGLIKDGIRTNIIITETPDHTADLQRIADKHGKSIDEVRANFYEVLLNL